MKNNNNNIQNKHKDINQNKKENLEHLKPNGNIDNKPKIVNKIISEENSKKSINKENKENSIEQKQEKNVKVFTKNIITTQTNVLYLAGKKYFNNLNMTRAYNIDYNNEIRAYETKSFHLIFYNEVNINFEDYKNQLFKNLNLKDSENLMILAKNNNNTHIFLLLKIPKKYVLNEDDEKFSYQNENSKKIKPIIEPKLCANIMSIIKKDENQINSLGLDVANIISKIRNMIYIIKPIKEIIREGYGDILDIKELIDAKKIYSNMDANVPDEIEKENIWLYGPMIINKIEPVKRVYYKDYFLKELNDDWDAYENEQVVVLTLPLFYSEENLNYINTWSEPYSFYVKKMGQVLKIGFTKFIVISIKSIEETFENEVYRNGFEQKFKSIHYDDIRSLNVVMNRIRNPNLI